MNNTKDSIIYNENKPRVIGEELQFGIEINEGREIGTANQSPNPIEVGIESQKEHSYLPSFTKRNRMESIEYQIKNYPDNPKVSYDKFVYAIDSLLKLDANFTPNDEQYGALLNEAKYLLIQASAGTGKTETLIRKAFMRQFIYDIPSHKILGLAYTKKAATVMSKRYETLADKYNILKMRDTKFSTVHAYALKILTILQPYTQVLTDNGVTLETYPDGFVDEDGYPNEPELVHRTTEWYITEALNKMNAQYLISKSKEIAGVLTSITEKFLYKAESALDTNPTEDLMKYVDKESVLYSAITETFKMEDILRIYKIVRQLHKEDQVVSYEEMLVQLYTFLSQLKTISDLEKYHSKDILKFYIEFLEIYVDEYQDITPIQESIVRELLRLNPDARLICTGDVSQSIFSFSGATPELMLSFIERYSNMNGKVDLHYLVENRRSHNEIIDISNTILENQKSKFDAKMTGNKGPGGKVITLPSDNPLYKDIIVSDVWTQYQQNSSINIAIIYRENKMAREFLWEFINKRIPMNYKGPNPFFSLEMNIIESSLGLMLNPGDTSIYPRVLPYIFDVDYTLAMSIKKSVEKYNHSNPEKKAVFSNFLPRTEKNNKNLENLRTAYNLFKSNRIPACLDVIRQMVTSIDSGKKNQRYDWESLSLVADFLSRYESKTFFDQLAKDKHWFKENSVSYGGVIMNTIHGMKGDESEKVYILNVSDKTFPKVATMASMTDKQLESFITEERNLLYVALTRAIKDLVVILDKESMFGKEVMNHFK